MGANTNTMPSAAMPSQFGPASSGGRPGFTPMPTAPAGVGVTPMGGAGVHGSTMGTFNGNSMTPPSQLTPIPGAWGGGGGTMGTPQMSGGPLQQSPLQQSGACPTCGK